QKSRRLINGRHARGLGRVPGRSSIWVSDTLSPHDILFWNGRVASRFSCEPAPNHGTHGRHRTKKSCCKFALPCFRCIPWLCHFYPPTAPFSKTYLNTSTRRPTIAPTATVIPRVTPSTRKTIPTSDRPT